MLYDLLFAFLQTGRYREARKIVEVKAHTGAALCPFHTNVIFLTYFLPTLSVLLAVMKNSLPFHHHHQP